MISQQSYLEGKRKAIDTFRTQMPSSGVAGEVDSDAGLTPSLLASFPGAREIFFPVKGGV